jgi:hypothetical protein
VARSDRVTRALAATTVALVIAAPAAASLPIMNAGSSVGEGVPLKAYASITPRVHLFGDPVTATIAIVADTKWVDPARLQVGSDFAPYKPTKAPNVLRLRVGRFAQVTWTWTLRCLTSPCVPRTPPSDGSHVFRFKPAHIAYLRLDRKPAYQISASWPAIQVVSQVSPGVAAALFTTNRLNWRLDLTPVAAPTYRLSAGVLFGLAIAAAGGFGLLGLWLAWRWYLVVRPQRAVALPVDPGTQLERALAVLRYAHQHGDETLQRKAFERVAGELGVERADELTLIARELAWSPRTPEDAEVEEFAEQARGTQETQT